MVPLLEYHLVSDYSDRAYWTSRETSWLGSHKLCPQVVYDVDNVGLIGRLYDETLWRFESKHISCASRGTERSPSSVTKYEKELDGVPHG